MRTYCEVMQQHSAAQGGDTVGENLQRVLDFAGSSAGQRFCGRMIATFVETGVATYCDKIEGINQWDDVFAAATRPRHREAVTQLAQAVTREAVSTFFAPSTPPRRCVPGPVGLAGLLALRHAL